MASRPGPRHTALPTSSVRRLQLVGGSALVAALLFGGTYAAHADPGIPSAREVAQAKAEAAAAGQRVAALEAQYATSAASVSALQERAARLGEAANGAKWQLAKATKAADEAQRKADAAQGQAAGASVSLRNYASSMYQQGGMLGSLAPLLDAGGPQELIDRAATLELVSAHQNEELKSALVVSGTAQSLQAAAAQAEAARAEASRRADQADRIARDELAVASAKTSRLGAERESLAKRLAALNDTSAKLEKQRLDAIAAAAAAEHDQSTNSSTSSPSGTPPPVTTSTSTPTSSSTTHPTSTTTTRPTSTTTTRPTSTTTTLPTSTTTTRPTSTTTTPSSSTSTPSSTTTSQPPPPPPSGGAAAAIAFAVAQLGKPYEWGADGPDTYDCSGLTMMAWAQAGVSLSHYTGAQWAETARVAIDALQPGDLVFYGSTGESSYHVGLYVGGGQMIEAPHTGAVVRYASIYRSDLLPYGGRPG